MSARFRSTLPVEAREEAEDASSTPAVRAGSLRLLKSKLRASGKGRRKTSQQITSIQVKAAGPNASVANATRSTNQQDEAAEVDLLPSGVLEPQGKASVAQTDRFNQKQEDPKLASPVLSLAELKQAVPELEGNFQEPPGKESVAGIAPTELERPSAFPIKLKSYTKTVIEWSCATCERECIPVREESRCLCGHRYKEHPGSADDPRVKSKAGFRAFACTSARCKCKHFFYVVAEGAWILRCRCKHKHTDHDAGAKPHACTKPKCACTAFDSPWVCNCDHAWAAHRQRRVERRFDPLQLLQAQCAAPELNAVHRTDLLASPLHLGL